MNKKATSNTEEEIKSSVSSLYGDLLRKRQAEKEEKDRKRYEMLEAKKLEKEAKEKNPDGTKKSKSQRRQEEFDVWKDIVSELTGEDLEYSKPKKKKKKKYTKWIDDDDSLDAKKAPKKHKKKNFNKEFAPELNMLKTLLTEQNKFTADLQKRFIAEAGTADKSAPLTRNIVDFASVINASRDNSFKALNQIGRIKKDIADLYMKQKKLDADLGSGNVNDSADIALMGSNIAAKMFGDTQPVMDTYSSPVYQQQPVVYNAQQQSQSVQSTPQQQVDLQQPSISVQNSFDPELWGGPEISNEIKYESVPHSVVVEWHKDEGKARFKAVRDSDGTELVGCPVPTVDPSKLSFNERDKIVKGQFDETYRLEIL